MPITLGSNIASLKSQRRLADGTASLSKTFERLSSGQRINRASDDAAGLAIADSLNARSRIFNQGIRNLNDGLSLLNIADSAIETLSGIMTRLEELAAQSANGVYSNEQRKALDGEAQALSDEFFRVSKTTEFNGQKLFTGELQSFTLQAGVGNNAVLSVGVGGAIGTGSFIEQTTFTSNSTRGETSTLGDLNGDGILDLVVGGAVGAMGNITVFLGTGSGDFQAGSSYTLGSSLVKDVGLGDLNGDGVLDLVTGQGNGSVTVQLGTGDGSFDQYISYGALASAVQGVALGDVNGDGNLDVVAAGDDGGEGGALVLLGHGNGSLYEGARLVTEEESSMAAALSDFNGDGILDLVTVGEDASSDGELTLFLGNGSGGFTQSDIDGDGSGVFHDVAVADFNADGNVDFVVGGGKLNGSSIVYFGNGDGTVTQGPSVSPALPGPPGVQGVEAADVNGDGFADIIVAGAATGTDGGISVILGAGDGSFGAALSFMTTNDLNFSVSAGDFNGDGVVDLATVGDNLSLGTASVMIGQSKEGIAPLLPFSLQTLADARQALPVFKRKREQLAAQRGQIGAFQSRIDVARNLLEVSSENFRAAESRIRDADVADESSRLVRLNILQQAASSVLAQANQQPAIALQLLNARRSGGF